MCVTTSVCTLARFVAHVDDYKAKMQTLDSFIHTFEFELKITKTESAACISFSIDDIEISI